MKISEIPTDTFPAELSEARLDELESILSDALVGNKKRLSQLNLQCQLEQCRRGKRLRPAKVQKSTEEQEEELVRSFRRYDAIYRLRHIILVEPAASRGRGKKKVRSDADQRIFNAAADHALGCTSDFPSLAAQACASRSETFFTIAAEAVAAVNAQRKNETKITCHVRMALAIFLEIERVLKRFPTRWEIREWITDDWSECYSEESDWNHVWNGAELEFLKKGRQGAANVRRLRNACGGSD